MTYNAKINWKHDDPVTEQDFNRIEEGVKDAHDELKVKADKTYVDGRVKTPVPKDAVFTEEGIKKVKVNAAKDADTVGGHTVAKDVPADAKLTDTIVDISGKADKTALDELSTVFDDFKGNIEKIRKSDDGSLEFYDGETWARPKAGTEFKLGNVESMEAKAKAGLKIEVTFGDPEDSTVVDENGDVITLAKYAGTMLRGKVGSYPVDHNDGELLDNYSVRNKYKRSPFVHSGLNNGDHWFYMAFPYTETGVYTTDSANRADATATNKLDQPAPAAPSVSELDFDRAKVTGGDLVSLDGNTWHDSPHLFTGLTEETTYIAYAKYMETDEFLESPVSPGKTFTTPFEAGIYGIQIDENNSNPETSVTYTDDAVGFTPAKGNNGNFSWGSWEEVIKEEFQIAPVLLNNPQGTVNYYLDYNDFTKKANGGNSNLSGSDGDVMIEFGQELWWKFNRIGNVIQIKFSAKQFDGAVNHAFDIEDGYNQLSFYPLTMLQILFLLMFKNRDTQTALGRGYVDGNSNYLSTGSSNNRPFMFGETTGKQQIKFLGLEDYWGNRRQWIDGVFYDNSRNMLIGKGNFNDTGSGYENFGRASSSNLGGYIDKVQGGNNTGFIPKSTSGSDSTHYADYGYLNAGRLPNFGGNRSNGSDAGGFHLDSYTASHSHAHIGGRLAFYSSATNKLYIGAYLGATVSGKLRSVSSKTSESNKTIGSFRNLAKANN